MVGLRDDRLCVCILYLVAQRRLYLDSLQDFELLCRHLIEDTKEELRPYEILLPDICRHCLREYQPTQGGRVREKCWHCWEDAQPGFLAYYWPFRMSLVLGTTEGILESYMAQALSIAATAAKKETPSGNSNT